MPKYRKDGITLEFDHEPSDGELDKAFTFESNFKKSEDDAQVKDAGSILGGMGNRVSDIFKGAYNEIVPDMDKVTGLNRQSFAETSKIAGPIGSPLRAILSAPEMADGMAQQGADNAQRFMGPALEGAAPGRQQILQILSTIPGLGNFINSTDRAMNEGNMEALGESAFDVASTGIPAGLSGAKSVANAAGRGVRPSQLTRANHAVGGSSMGETVGTAAGMLAHSPYVGGRLGRVLTKGSDLSLGIRDKLANMLDPSGNPKVIQAQVEANLAGPNQMYSGNPVELPIERQWADQMIREEAGGKPAMPAQVEPLAPPYEPNPAPRANTLVEAPPLGGSREVQGVEGSLARILQEQAVDTAQRKGKLAQRQIEKLLSGNPKSKAENLVDPNTIINDASTQYESQPTTLPIEPVGVPQDLDIVLAKKLAEENRALELESTVFDPDTGPMTTKTPIQEATINPQKGPTREQLDAEYRNRPELFSPLEGSDQVTTSGGKLVKKGQGGLKGMEAEQAEAANLSNVSPYNLGDLAPNATRHKLENQRMKGTSTRQKRAKSAAAEIRKDPAHYDSLSEREQKYYDRFFDRKGRRRKNPREGETNKFDDNKEG